MLSATELEVTTALLVCESLKESCVEEEEQEEGEKHEKEEQSTKKTKTKSTPTTGYKQILLDVIGDLEKRFQLSTGITKARAFLLFQVVFINVVSYLQHMEIFVSFIYKH